MPPRARHAHANGADHSPGPGATADGDPTKFKPGTRSGAANLNSLWVVQASQEMAFSWNMPYPNGENTEPTASIDSYQAAMKFAIPNPGDQTISPEIHMPETCDNPDFSPVTVTCMKGACNMPRRMYTGTDTMGVCEGHAYGVVSPAEGDGRCDWRVDGGAHQAFYVSFDGTPRCSGVVDLKRPEGSQDAAIPTTVGIWVR